MSSFSFWRGTDRLMGDVYFRSVEASLIVIVIALKGFVGSVNLDNIGFCVCACIWGEGYPLKKTQPMNVMAVSKRYTIPPNISSIHDQLDANFRSFPPFFADLAWEPIRFMLIAVGFGYSKLWELLEDADLSSDKKVQTTCQALDLSRDCRASCWQSVDSLHLRSPGFFGVVFGSFCCLWKHLVSSYQCLVGAFWKSLVVLVRRALA